MAMNIGSDGDGDTIADINTTPLIDVMLVLLIMLIITIPPVRHAIVVDTPVSGAVQDVPQNDPVRIAIDFDGVVSWNGEAVERGEWERRMAIEARRSPQADIHVEPHRLADYGAVAAVMASAQRSGLERMGVVGGT